MFKINWCKIFGHKTYSIKRLKKMHNGTRKEQVIIISTTKCIRCGKYYLFKGFGLLNLLKM